jgi:DNA mismatch repair protein MutS2
VIYPNNLEDKIGFNKIRLSLKKLCLSSLGNELVDKMSFAISIRTIEKALEETNEFIKICQEEDTFPTAYYFDVRDSLEKIRIDGSFLDTHELFNLKRSLESIAAISRFFKNKEEKYPYLIEKCGRLRLYPYISQRLENIISKYGTIKDTASVPLGEVRREILKKQSSISRRMNALMLEAQKEGWADPETSISIRDGRMVIPVPSAHKRKIGGIIHDESSTGKTSYIEPTEIVETNNQIKELEYAERREVMKILISFCSEIRPYIDDLIPAYNFLGFIDFVRAKALYSLSIKGLVPNFENKAYFDWVNAYHPLLYLSNKEEGKPIVPLNIQLNEENRIVLISGPNAGGKSVCLKTVGLIQYMFQCGLPVPVSENSKMGIFNDIFIDIGDEQSMENDLSTYSSHLTNMKNFIKHSSSESLILIDEFGTGTEPMLGGSIAEAILHKLNNKKTKGVITTHYTNLKHYAESTNGTINGAMLYDSQHMKPLFELRIGKPGSSFAFEIAKKIGLPKDIIDDATNKIGSDHINFDQNLKDIARDKRYWENKRKKIHDNEKKLNSIIEKYDKELQEANKLRKDIIEEAKKEAEKIITDANKSIEKTIREIKEHQADKEKTKTARKELEKTKESLSEIKVDTDARISRKIRKLQEREEKRNKKVEKQTELIQIVKDKTKIEIGDNVKIKKSGNIGELIEINKTRAIVALGNLITTVNIKELEYMSKNKAKRSKSASSSSLLQENIYKLKMSFKPRIDLRGERGEEAILKTMEYIDEAIMVGANEVRILHGTGHGILRNMIREYLSTVNVIKSYKDESIQMGGSGITVVTFE